MTDDKLEAQSRAAIIAHLTDPSVQLEYTDRGIENWNSLEVIGLFNLMHFHYRIAKPKKFYRVCLDNDGKIVIAHNETHENLYETTLWFDRWLDERKYYD